MTRASRAEQRHAPDALAQGLTDWIRGEDTEQTDAAASLLAEWIIRSLDRLTQKRR